MGRIRPPGDSLSTRALDSDKIQLQKSLANH